MTNFAADFAVFLHDDNPLRTGLLFLLSVKSFNFERFKEELMAEKEVIIINAIHTKISLNDLIKNIFIVIISVLYSN